LFTIEDEDNDANIAELDDDDVDDGFDDELGDDDEDDGHCGHYCCWSRRSRIWSRYRT